MVRIIILSPTKGAEEADSSAIGGDNTLMGNRIDATRQPAEDDNPARRKTARQPVRHVRAIERWPARKCLFFGDGPSSGGRPVAQLPTGATKNETRPRKLRIASATWRKGSPQDRATQCQPWKCGIELHGEGPSREQRTLQL